MPEIHSRLSRQECKVDQGIDVHHRVAPGFGSLQLEGLRTVGLDLKGDSLLDCRQGNLSGDIAFSQVLSSLIEPEKKSRILPGVIRIPLEQMESEFCRVLRSIGFGPEAMDRCALDHTCPNELFVREGVSDDAGQHLLCRAPAETKQVVKQRIAIVAAGQPSAIGEVSERCWS